MLWTVFVVFAVFEIYGVMVGRILRLHSCWWARSSSKVRTLNEDLWIFHLHACYCLYICRTWCNSVKKKKKFSCNRRLRSFNRSVASIFIKSQILLLRAYQLISTIVLVDIYQLYIIIVCLLTISFRWANITSAYLSRFIGTVVSQRSYEWIFTRDHLFAANLNTLSGCFMASLSLAF